MAATLLWVGVATLVIVAALNYKSSSSTLANIEGHLRSSIEQKGNGLVTNQALALRDLVTDNAFGDVSRLVDRTVAQDPHVIYGLFLSAKQQPWGFAVRDAEGVSPARDWHELVGGGDVPLASGVRTAARRVFGEGVYEFATPVVDDKGVYLGSLRYGLSDQPLREALAEARAESQRALATTVVLLLLLVAGTIVLGVLRSRKTAAHITRPLGVLTEAVNAFARGERRTRVAIDSRDELELLGSAFNHMASELQDYYARLEQMNRTLEARVLDRTQALSERNRDMRLVLDNVDQGLLTISLDGRLAPERSAVVDRWFGSPESDADLVSYLRGVDRDFAGSLRLGLDALREDFMPLEVVLAQLPVRLRHRERDYHCGYCPIQVGERVQGLLIVIKDISAELASARNEADGRERLALFNAVAKNRLGLAAFIGDTNARLRHLPEATLEEQRRTLHTLKGNAGQIGLGVLASICHALEDRMAEASAPVADAGFEPLRQRWAELSEQLSVWGEKSTEMVELPRAEFEALLADLEAGAPRSSLRGSLAALALEPAERQLRPLGQYAQALARQLGKGELEFEVDDGSVRLEPRQWGALWAEMVHVVRNAVDHGIEDERVRAKAAKPSQSRLRLATRLDGRSLLIEIEDDGAGIDWQAVRAAAALRQLPCETEAELVCALFSDGLSTRAQVSETSGRGIGLGALRRQVELRAGTIAVYSKAGAGCRFTFSFPLSFSDATVAVSRRGGSLAGERRSPESPTIIGA
jgi:two-component system chemotaxis sensor kinase CheA